MALRSAKSRAILALLGTLVGACQTEYDPPSLVNKLRIIAARAEPPFLSFSASPTLELKVIGHDESQPLCHAWAVCLLAAPAGGNYRCVDPRLQTPLGTAPTAKVGLADLLKPMQQLPAVLKDLGLDLGIADAGGATASSCPEAPDKLPLTSVQILFKVAEAGVFGGACPADPAAMLDDICPDSTRCLAGYKRLTLAIDLEVKDCKPVPVAAPKKEHANPELIGLTFGGVPWPAAVTPVLRPFIPTESIVDLDNAALDFEEGANQVELVPTWTPESLEVIGQSPDPTKGEIKEELLFSWFSDRGDYKKQRSFSDIPENHFRPDAPGGADDPPVRIWIVARDGRGGTDWLERTLLVRQDAQTSHNAVCEAASDLPGCP